MLKVTTLLCCATIALAGCSSSWTTSKVTGDKPAKAATPVAVTEVTLTTDDTVARPYERLGDVAVTVSKTTAFHPTPTPQLVIAKLKKKAASLGADAVISANISKPRVTPFSWAARSGSGIAIKYLD